MKYKWKKQEKDLIENTPRIKIKKYNVHGKITAGEKPGTTEISYYECDAIKCRKIVISH